MTMYLSPLKSSPCNCILLPLLSCCVLILPPSTLLTMTVSWLVVHTHTLRTYLYIHLNIGSHDSDSLLSRKCHGSVSGSRMLGRLVPNSWNEAVGRPNQQSTACHEVYRSTQKRRMWLTNRTHGQFVLFIFHIPAKIVYMKNRDSQQLCS